MAAETPKTVERLHQGVSEAAKFKLKVIDSLELFPAIQKGNFVLDILGMLFGVVLGLFIAWWIVAQWSECREAGLSILYCIQHVS